MQWFEQQSVFTAQLAEGPLQKVGTEQVPLLQTPEQQTPPLLVLQLVPSVPRSESSKKNQSSFGHGRSAGGQMDSAVLSESIALGSCIVPSTMLIPSA